MEPRTSQREERRSGTLNEPFRQNNRKQPGTFEKFSANKVLAPSPTRNKKPQHTEHYEEGTVMMHHFKNFNSKQCQLTRFTQAKRSTTCDDLSYEQKSE